MSRVVKNNRGFLQLLADFPKHQRQFLLRTATPQQIHALMQVLYNALKQYIPVPEEYRQKLRPYNLYLISQNWMFPTGRKSTFLCKRVMDLFKNCWSRF